MLCLFVLDRYCVLMLVCLVCLIAYGYLFVLLLPWVLICFSALFWVLFGWCRCLVV